MKPMKIKLRVGDRIEFIGEDSYRNGDTGTVSFVDEESVKVKWDENTHSRSLYPLHSRCRPNAYHIYWKKIGNLSPFLIFVKHQSKVGP